MSKVLDLVADHEVIGICVNPDCNADIHFGQAAFKTGTDLTCSAECLMQTLGVVVVTAGRVEGERKVD